MNNLSLEQGYDSTFLQAINLPDAVYARLLPLTEVERESLLATEYCHLVRFTQDGNIEWRD